MEKKGSFLERTTRASVQAVAEVYFPENDLGAPDWKQTQMVERTMAYLMTIPPRNRRLIRILYMAVEWLAPLWLAGIGRFSKRSLAFRKRAVHRWQTWDFIVFRLLSDALKAQLTMTYCSHPAVQKYVGVWKTCAREADPYPFPTRTGFLEAFVEQDAQKAAEMLQ